MAGLERRDDHQPGLDMAVVSASSIYLRIEGATLYHQAYASQAQLFSKYAACNPVTTHDVNNATCGRAHHDLQSVLLCCGDRYCRKSCCPASDGLKLDMGIIK